MAVQRKFPNTYAFNSGELSPLLANRQDQARYAYGARRMRNFIPALQGPARKRPGNRFLAEIADSSRRAWLVPFIFSQRDAWVLEFGDETVRFYTDHGQVVEATKAITAATVASQAVFTSVAHGYLDGQEIVLASVVGLLNANGNSIVNGRNFRVSDKTADTFKLKDLYGNYLDSSGATAYTSGGTAARIYEIASPWGISDLTDSTNGCCLLSFAQSGDVLYLCVPGFRSQKLTRSGTTSWAFSDFSPTAGPFKTVDPDETITVYCSAETGAGETITASSAIFTAEHVGSLFYLEKALVDNIKAWEVGKVIAVNSVRRSQGNYYKALNNGKTTGTITPSHTEGARFDGDDGVQWQYLHSGYGWVTITAVTSPPSTTATVDIVSTIPTGAVGAGNPSTRWAFSAWSDAEGWPTHVAFFRERLCFARDTKIWMSVPSDFENFAAKDAGVVATDSAIAIDIRSGVNNSIKWMTPSSDLLVGTDGGEFSIGEISTADPIGPDNIASLSGPGYGSRQVTPPIVNDAVMYVLPSGRVMRELRFDFSSDGYVALNRTAFAEHIAKGQLIQLSYQKEPESIVWGNCLTGDLIAMSFEREHELMAWHKHPVAPSLAGAGLVESNCSIPSPDGDRDEVYVIVKRTINGQTKRYIEFSEAHFDPDTDAVADMKYADCALPYSGPATSILTNLQHLEGESVPVFGGGRDLGDFTVANGEADLGDAEVTQAYVGLGYEAVLESMNLIQPGVQARIVALWVRFVSTISAFFQTTVQRDLSSETLPAQPAPIVFGNISVTAPATPVTRLIKAAGDSGTGRELTWVIVHNRPTYCNVAGVVPEFIVTTEK